MQLGLGLFTPKSSKGGSHGEQRDLVLSTSEAKKVKKKVDELYCFINERRNVHGEIHGLVAEIKMGMLAVVREQQAWCARAEKAENDLENMKIRAPQSSRAGKRDRETPGEEEVAKKQKEDKVEKKEKEGEGSGWQTVRNKKEKSKEEKKTNLNEEECEKEKKSEEKKKEQKKSKQKKERSKGDALVVAAKDGASYADLLRKVRSDPELKELGENVVKTRRTQKGEILFELKNKPSVRSVAFKQLVEKSLGEEANVRALSQETVIECRFLDEITTEDELRSALSGSCDSSDVPMVIRMRKSYGGTQTAVIRLSTSAANKLLEVSKIKVGWSSGTKL